MEGLKVIIVGAGMGGLTAALAMQQLGYDVEIYDRAQRLEQAGAAISLWSNGVKVLNRLGLGREIAAIGGRMEGMTYRRSTGELLTDFCFEPLVRRVGQRPYPVSRADLQQMLLAAVGPERVRLGHTCVGVEEDDQAATAVFEGGHRATGDLVVGADGTHSTIRDHVLGRATRRRYAGYVNWNGLVPADPAFGPEGRWVVHVGAGQRASVMPVGDRRLYFFFDVPLPLGLDGRRERYREELSRHFDGWAPPVRALIERLDPERTNRIEIHDIEPLPRLVRGRLALLGDAAHSTTPDLGQGGCQAMEDAWVLGNVLCTTNRSVPDALSRYEAARLSRTAGVVLRARARAHMIHGADPETTQSWYDELAREDGSRILRAIGDTIEGGPLG